MHFWTSFHRLCPVHNPPLGPQGLKALLPQGASAVGSLRLVDAYIKVRGSCGMRVHTVKVTSKRVTFHVTLWGWDGQCILIVESLWMGDVHVDGVDWKLAGVGQRAERWVIRKDGWV